MALQRPCRLNIEDMLDKIVLSPSKPPETILKETGPFTLKVQAYQGSRAPPKMLGYTNIRFSTVSDALWMLKMHIDPTVDVDDDERHSVRVFDKINGRIYDLVPYQRLGHIPFPYKQA